MTHRLATVGIAGLGRGKNDDMSITVGAQLGAYKFTDLQAEPEGEPRPQVSEISIIGGDLNEADLTKSAHLARCESGSNPCE